MLVAMPLLAEAIAMEPKKCVGVKLQGVSIGLVLGLPGMGYEGFGRLCSLPF